MSVAAEPQSAIQAYAEAIGDMLAMQAVGDLDGAEASTARLAEAMRDVMVRSHATTALSVLRTAARLLGDGERFALAPVALEDAAADLTSRAPVVVRDAAERASRIIARLYSREHVIGFARSASMVVTERVQALIADAVREGWAEVEAGRIVRDAVRKIRKKAAEWTQAYAALCVRTNIATATSTARIEQARDPDIRGVIPALRFVAVLDSDTRPNHAAADGLVLSVDNPDWQRMKPPLGYNCRCRIEHVTRPELRRMGRLRPDGGVLEMQIPAGAGPDEGFRP
jgi:SPP1 gp7 family putative phage head morphogenesis protein